MVLRPRDLPVAVIARCLGEAHEMLENHESAFSWIRKMRLVNHEWRNAVTCWIESDCTEQQPELKSTGTWSPMISWRIRPLGYFRLFLISASSMSSEFLESIRTVNLAHSNITDSDFHRFAQVPAGVRSLDVTFCVRLTKSGLRSLPEMPELQSLSISFTDQATNAAFFSKFPSLRNLTLQTSKPPLDEALSDIFEHSLPHLQSFSVSDCSCLGNQSLVSLSRRNELTLLDLHGCGKATDENFTSLARNLRSLRSLTLTWNLRITPSALHRLSDMAELKVLNLGYTNVSNSTLEAVGQLVRLERLNLSGCVLVSHVGIECLSGLALLTHLTLTGCSQLTDGALSVLAKLQLLENIELAGCTRLTDESCKALAQLPKLEVLDLSENENITDDGIKALAHAPLEAIILRDCSSLTDDCVDALVSVETLQSVNLQGCPQVTPSSLTRFPPRVYLA